MRIVVYVALGFAGGGTFALAFLHGAKQLRDDVAPPILRATPRPTEWQSEHARGRP